MRDPLTVPAEAYVPDANRAGPGAPAQPPEWLARWIALLIFFLLEPFNTVRLLRSGRLQSWWQERADLPAGSAQAEAASIRGHFGNAIAWMCYRRGIGPGHKDWPELSRAIVAFGGNVAGFRAGFPAGGLHWWENPTVVPGIVPGFGVPAAAGCRECCAAGAGCHAGRSRASRGRACKVACVMVVRIKAAQSCPCRPRSVDRAARLPGTANRCHV
jgi:hypothetical protein